MALSIHVTCQKRGRGVNIMTWPKPGPFDHAVSLGVLGKRKKTQKLYSQANILFVNLNQKPYCIFFFNCVFSKLFWKDFEFYFYSLSKEFVHVSLQDVLIGITTSECPLLNYFLLIAKLYIWDCRGGSRILHE